MYRNFVKVMNDLRVLACLPWMMMMR